MKDKNKYENWVCGGRTFRKPHRLNDLIGEREMNTLAVAYKILETSDCFAGVRFEFMANETHCVLICRINQEKGVVDLYVPSVQKVYKTYELNKDGQLYVYDILAELMQDNYFINHFCSTDKPADQVWFEHELGKELKQHLREATGEILGFGSKQFSPGFDGDSIAPPVPPVPPKVRTIKEYFMTPFEVKVAGIIAITVGACAVGFCLAKFL